MELRISKLCKSYGNGVQALNNITLTIPCGMFGLLGPNGAGKSTLMRTLATLQEADSGSVFLDDIDVLDETDEVRRLLGYLPQDFGVYPKVSAYELLDHFARLKGLSDSKLIIVDEPTAGLDPEERVRFHNLLSDIGHDKIIILSTHMVPDVSDLCANMAVINKGQLLLTGEPLQLIQQAEGLIWQRFVEKDELARFQQEHQVISTRLMCGRTQIHVYSAQNPGRGFESVAPTLEDVYFSTMYHASQRTGV
ncbi:MAG: ATP-binding cassette domain-containing protein [Burkholderiales bacterium]|nr:ATP-binding cassette domain-containing protein [Burkholderiales bacterium]